MDDADVQALINSGMAWRLEGSIGRTCMAYLEAGRVMCGTEARKDFWGNVVPSRYDVQPGTKGSFDLVELRMGLEHAKAMADVGDDVMGISF